MRFANATTLLHMHLTAYNTNVSYAVNKQDEMPPRVLLHSGMSLQGVTQQSKKAIIDQRIAARQTCCYNVLVRYGTFHIQ